MRGFRQKLAHGGGVAVNVGVRRQVQIQQGSREGLHGRLAEHRAPAKNQSIGHGTLENGRSLSGFGLCQKSNEGGCFLAPPAADFNAQDDQFTAPRCDQFWVSSLFAAACCVQGCPCKGPSPPPEEKS